MPSVFDAAGIAEWQRLRQHLLLQDGFILGYLFTRHALVIQQLHTQVAAHYQAQGTPLHTLTPSNPEDLTPYIDQQLLIPSNSQPIWLNLHHTAPDSRQHQTWQTARRQFMLRLNERREILRQRPAALFLVLPLAEKRDLRTLSPDLWAIRDLVVETANWLPNSPPTIPAPSTLPQISQPLDAYQRRLVTEWERLRDADQRTHEALRAANQAFSALFRQGQIHQAHPIATWMHQTARHILAQDSESAIAQRDLSVSLNNVGDTHRALDNLQAAQQHYTESLEICRTLHTQLSDTSQMLRDLSIGLDRVGDTHRTLGDLQAAQQHYTESLEMRRTLHTQLGDTSEGLRDLSVSLDNVGDTHQDLGDLQAAQQHYTQSLAIRRTLHTQLGDTPEVLRDLSVSLNNVGDTHQALGDPQAAQQHYTQSLQICRTLHTQLGDTPEALRDLVASLARVGDIHKVLNNIQTAHQTYTEGLHIAKHLAQTWPELHDHVTLPNLFQERLAQLPTQPTEQDHT